MWIGAILSFLLNFLWKLLKFLFKSLIKLGFFFIVLAVFYNFFYLYNAVIFYHLSLTISFIMGLFSWTSGQISFLLMLRFIPYILLLMKIIINKFVKF